MDKEEGLFVWLLMGVHFLVYMTLVLSTFLLWLPGRTRFLQAVAHTLVLLSFLWFRRCWVIDLERRLLGSSSSHFFLPILLLLPRSARFWGFGSLQLCLAIWAWIAWRSGV
jgi:hypothetical protein